MTAETETLTVPHGRAVAEAVRDVIRQVKATDPMAPVTVAVHSAWAGLSLRRLLASGALGPVSGDRAGLVNVSFITIARVAELLGAPALAAAGRRPLPAAVRAEAVRAALLEAPGLFETAASHPSTAVALDATLAELRRCPDELVDILAARSRRSSEVVRLCRSAQSRLGDWYDETDLARAATAAMQAATPAPALAEIGHLVTAGLEPLPPALLSLVEAFAARASTGIPVVIRAEPVDQANPAHAATNVATCPDPDEEVRTVVRRVAAALEEGTPLHRMAIFHPTGTYARLIHQQLAAAGIPFNGPPVRTLGSTVAGATLRGLLEMLDGDFRRDEVIGWLASAPILDLEGREVPSTGWDRVSKTAGVVKGPTQWADRLAAFAAAQESRAAEAEAGTSDDNGAGEWKAASARRAAARATKLAEFVAELVHRLADGAPPPGALWQDWSSWACGLLDRYLGPATRHGEWPDEDQESFVSVREALESLASLDAVGATPDATAFRAAAARALDGPAGRVGKFGSGVMVGGLHQGRGTDFDRVWIVGLAEGLLPATRSSGSLLTDEDRQAALDLWQGREAGAVRTLDTRSTRRAREAESLAGALAAAGGAATLTWSRAELRSGRPRLPSRWLLAAVSGLLGRRVGLGDLEDASREDERITEVVSFSDGMARVDRAAESAASLHDRDVVELYSWRRRGGGLADHPSATQGPAGAFVRTAAERSTPFSRFSGRIPEGELQLARGHSATKLEMYARCPFRWYLAEALGLRPEEAPEELIRMDVRDKGTLVHQILEDFIVGVIAGEPRTAEGILAHCERRFAEFAQSGRVGKALLWEYDKTVIRRELRRFVKEDKRQPIAAELSFGRSDDQFGPVVVQAGGATVAFSGKADRVDREPDGSLVVTDYKTGRREKQADFDDDPIRRGTKLQLPIYGRAARNAYGDENTPVRARYWFVSEGGSFGEVVVDLDASTERFQAALEVIANGISAGYFPARPGANEYMGFSNCRFCDFDTVCHSDRDRRWEAIRGDDALRSYVELSEGDA